MELRDIYTLVLKKLNKIDFESLWDGFHRYGFALYDDEMVYLEDDEIPVDNRFLGNTCIYYEGEQIAIWKIENEDEVKDLDLFTANIVHEMFHCFQHETNDKRYPNDLILLDYPEIIENFSLKYQENLELVKGLESKEAFTNFVSIRRRRREIIGDIIEQEFRAEAIEGLAEYIGTIALKQLSIDKYNDRIKRYTDIITTIDDIHFYIRKTSYFTGTLFFIALSNHSYNLNTNLATEATFFTQLTNSYPFDTYNKKIVINKKINNKLNNYHNTKAQKIDEFLNTHHHEEKFYSNIYGYDPMNMIKLNNMILCTNFILLKQIDGDGNMFIKQPVLLKMQAGSERIVKSYII